MLHTFISAVLIGYTTNMGKPIHGEARTVILKVLKFFEAEKRNKAYSYPVDIVIHRAAAAVGVSTSTLMRIKKEASLQIPSSQYASIEFSTLVKKRKSRVQIKLDCFDYCELRNMINSFYINKKKILTLDKLLVIAQKGVNFPGRGTALRSIVCKELGYKFIKRKTSKQMLVLEPEIAACRALYLRHMIQNDELGSMQKPVTYMDDTWLCSGVGNDSKRWVFVNAGGQNGFIAPGDFVQQTKSKKGSYYYEMNICKLINWLQEKVVPKLPENGIIEVGNGLYRATQINKTPTCSASIGDIQSYLRTYDIPFTGESTGIVTES